MVHRATLASWLLLALATTACGGDDGSAAVPAGLWLGDRLDFAVCDGEVRNVSVQDVSCAAVKDGTPCTRDASGVVAGSFRLDGDTLTVQADHLEIVGTFDGNGFAGSYTYLDPECCAVTGEVAVHFQAAGVGCEAGVDTVGGDTLDDLGGDDVPPADDTAGEAVDPVQVAQDLVNAARVAAGAPAVTLDDRLVQAAQAHADYVAKWFQNYTDLKMSVHLEDPDWSGFTGETFRERIESFGYPFTNGWEIIAFNNDPSRAVPTWLETLYHRVPIVHPNAFQIGYGGAKVGGARTDVMEFAGTYAITSTTPVAWPHDGMTDVSVSWQGLEEPQPYLPPQVDEPQGYPSGPVVTLEFPFAPDVTAARFDLADAVGNAVPCQVLGPQASTGQAPVHPFREDAHLVATYALIPFDPIAPHTRFTATFEGTLDGAPFSTAWSFTTGAAQ